MSIREDLPGDRGEKSTTTKTVADIIDALALPPIQPLATDIEALSGLPELPVPASSGPASWSQLDGVRALMDGCGDAIAALRRHQNRCAAHVAVMVERMEATAVLEGGLLSLDWWQRSGSIEQIKAELAVLLHVTEGAAGRLIDESITLVRLLPATMEKMSSGHLGWDYAVVIAEQATLLRDARIGQQAIDSFERQLLGQATDRTLSSFKSTARRIRERSYPESMVARTRRAYADRHLRVSRGEDGMSWMSLYAPSPTIEAIWDQCSYTAQAATGPHEGRTMTQLRADVAAALLLRQSMAENSIHAPAPGMGGEPSADVGPEVGTGPEVAVEPKVGVEPHPQAGTEPGQVPEFCDSGDRGDPGCADTLPPSWMVPLFDDPKDKDLAFLEPDPRNFPDWRAEAQLPVLTQVGTLDGTAASGVPGVCSGTSAGRMPGVPSSGSCGSGFPASGSRSADLWPPLPQVTPVILIPALSLLGETNAPAWMEGAGPISMEVARKLTAQAGSFLRVLVDPITNMPLDIAPDRYRISRAMRTMLLIRDEYCQFPGCMAKAINCEVDHVKSFESGGRSIYNNLEHLCSHHHMIKHYKDDKDRHGRRRCIDEPERESLRLRGWTPRMEEDGRISWTSPAGRYCPPEVVDRQAPAYPEWIKGVIDGALDQDVPDEQPEAPAEFALGNEDDEILAQLALQRGLNHPGWGLADAA